MGNIYGGGWAQKGGTSTVTGDVNITVGGDAKINNVFGGGSYSSVSGGATSVGGDVNITVAGGAIYNNIFAGGQGDFSTVGGGVRVSFTGSNDYACNVFGYGHPESATAVGDKSLEFVDYTGELSGDIGGFDGIVFTGNTSATLSGTTIDNTVWSFDYTGRTFGADIAMLTFDNGTFAGGELTLKLAASAAPADWNIAVGLADTAVGFDYTVYVGNVEQTFVDGKVASGDYAGWSFVLEDSTLKFKQLA